MSIFDIFSFKSKLQEVATKENFDLIRDLIKQEIIKQVKKKIEGSEKMDNVVETIVNYIKEHIHSDNKIVQWLIDNILIANIRTIAQAIYDDLKEIIKGL